MPTTLDRVEKSTAIHEAGHAVALLVELPDGFFGAFRKVVVRTRREADISPYIDTKGRERDALGLIDGDLHGSSDVEYFLGLKPRPLSSTQLAVRLAGGVSAYAGPVAEAMLCHYNLEANLALAIEDMKAARAVAWCLANGKSEADILEEFLHRAKTIVREQKAVILAVADRLILERTLDEDQVRMIMAAA